MATMVRSQIIQLLAVFLCFFGSSFGDEDSHEVTYNKQDVYTLGDITTGSRGITVELTVQGMSVNNNNGNHSLGNSIALYTIVV